MVDNNVTSNRDVSDDKNSSTSNGICKPGTISANKIGKRKIMAMHSHQVKFGRSLSKK